MERILSVEQMRAADAFNIEKLGVTAEALTERAGEAVAREIVKRLKGGRVLVCLGKDIILTFPCAIEFFMCLTISFPSDDPLFIIT